MTHVSRTPKPEYLIARSQLTERGPLGFGPFQFLMEKTIGHGCCPLILNDLPPEHQGATMASSLGPTSRCAEERSTTGRLPTNAAAFFIDGPLNQGGPCERLVKKCYDYIELHNLLIEIPLV